MGMRLYATRRAANPARSKRRLAKKAAPAPSAGYEGAGTYERDQVMEETRTQGQHGKKRAAGFRGDRSCRPRLKTTLSSLLPASRRPIFPQQ
jgi:hypothetical protein